ncbi:MAG TPA: malectin domain-containing carbohydrate-binding protein, partial [Actinomycetales bacterium]
MAVLAAAALTLVIGPTTASTSAQAAATPHAIRLIASASSVVDAQGAVWSPDARFADGGTTWVSSAAIASTTDDKVFQPERWGVRGYDIPVPASGSYRVTLNAAEVVYRDAGRRVFSVLAEGTRVVQDLDLVRAAGFAGAHSVTFTTTVTDGELNLDLVASIENTKVSSLKVEAVSGTPAVARVVAGGSSVTDASGAVWASDRMYAEGGTTWTSTQAIAGTTNDRIFQAERWGVRGYSIPVPAAGTYAVTLNAAEVAFTLTGQRVFSIVAEGQTKISNLDLVRTVGAAAAHSSRFDVTVADGVLNLSLPASVNSSKVSSIAVDSGSSTTAIVTPAPTPTPTP